MMCLLNFLSIFREKILQQRGLQHLISFSTLGICSFLSQRFCKNVPKSKMWKLIVISHWTFYSATSIFAVWELRFEKSGSRIMVREIWFEKSGWLEKKLVLYHKSNFFHVREKWLTWKKNQSLQNHFSRTTFLNFSRKMVAE